jgi:hypothetical protein
MNEKELKTSSDIFPEEVFLIDTINNLRIFQREHRESLPMEMNYKLRQLIIAIRKYFLIISYELKYLAPSIYQ